jgi:predicted transcriptional regulator
LYSRAADRQCSDSPARYNSGESLRNAPIMSAGKEPDYVSLAAQIVASYVGNHTVSPGEIPALLDDVHKALVRVARGARASGEASKPAVPPARSVTRDYIVCLEDGKKFKSLRRHLKSRYGMSPEQYRAKWGLAADYPMVAPNYAAHRSALARKIGLGRRAGRRK